MGASIVDLLFLASLFGPLRALFLTLSIAIDFFASQNLTSPFFVLIFTSDIYRVCVFLQVICIILLYF